MSAGQGTCAFCQRQQQGQSSNRLKLVAILLAVLTLVAIAAVLFAVPAWRKRTTLVIPEPPPAPRFDVEVTATAILVAGQKVVELPARAEQVSLGAGAATKRAQDPSNLYVVPVGDALAHPPQKPDPGPLQLTIHLASDTPYRVLIEVVFTAGQSGVKLFHLSSPASNHGPATQVLVHAPERRPPPGTGVREDPESHFVAFIVNEGIALKVDGGNIAPGCEHVGPGVAVQGWDYSTLASCIRRLREVQGAGPLPIGTLTANPGVPAATVLHVGNILRCGESACPPGRAEPPLVDFRQLAVPR